MLNHLLDQTYALDEIHSFLLELYEEDGFEIEMNEDSDVPEGELIVSGYYEPESDDIELVINYNPIDEEIEFTDEVFESFSHQLQQTVEHELIHRKQGLDEIMFRTSSCKKSYLSAHWEVDAFSNDIALDIKYNNGDLAIMKGSHILNDYIEAFGKSSDIVKNIIKKAYKRLYV